MKVFFTAVLMMFSHAALGMEFLSAGVNRLAKQYSHEIIKQSGKVQIFVPSGFLEKFPKHPPMERFLALIQQSTDVRQVLAEYGQEQFSQYRDPRPDYEKVHSRLKRNELVKEFLLRPDKSSPLVISPLEARKVMEKYRMVATNELDVTTTNHLTPILCTTTVGVSVAVVMANIKTKKALMAHAMESSVLDGSFKRCVEELVNECDHADDLQLTMLTTDMAKDFRIIEGVQSKIEKFFETEAKLKIKTQKHVLKHKTNECVNICYDPRDNSIFRLSGHSRIPFKTAAEVMEHLLQEKRICLAWFMTDFSDRRNRMEMDIVTRTNVYFSELQAPFIYFQGMNSLGLECVQNADFPYSLVTKEDVLQFFFKDIL